MRTQTELVKDLEAKPPSPHRDGLIVKAKAGQYSDFKSDLSAPKLQLRHDLTAARFVDLARKVMDGDYD